MHDIVFHDEGEDANGTAAARAAERIDLEEALQELGPVSSAGITTYVRNILKDYMAYKLALEVQAERSKAEEEPQQGFEPR